MNIAKSFCLAAVLDLLVVVTAGAAGTVPTKFVRMDLLDGRTLTNVELVSYDAASGKVLLIADQKAMLVPVDLIPAPFAGRLKHELPEAGATASVVGNAPAATVHPIPGADRSGVIVTPTVPVPPAPMPVAAGAAAADQTLAGHKQAAEARAARYYRFEYQAGSAAIMVTALQIETDQPEEVQGWPGRYRTEGRAFMEFYDSKGGSFSRATSKFEVLTEQKPGKPISAVEFIPK